MKASVGGLSSIHARLPRSVKPVLGDRYGDGMTDYPVAVVRSRRRKKTASAAFVDGKIQVRVPEGMPQAEVERVVEELTAKVKRRLSSDHVDLEVRARQLADRYDLPVPAAISWSSRQNTRWASCTKSSRVIRVSDRVAAMPGWVLDAVIVHELAHLVEDNHSDRFWALANRYEKTERARGYLEAMSSATPHPIDSD